MSTLYNYTDLNNRVDSIMADLDGQIEKLSCEIIDKYYPDFIELSEIADKMGIATYYIGRKKDMNKFNTVSMTYSYGKEYSDVCIFRRTSKCIKGNEIQYDTRMKIEINERNKPIIVFDEGMDSIIKFYDYVIIKNIKISMMKDFIDNYNSFRDDIVNKINDAIK